MNTLLEKLFEKYNLSEKDKYEIRQIYDLLPSDKKQNLLNNFESLALRLNKKEEEINSEREVLLWGIITDLERAVNEERRRRIVLWIK